MTLYTKYGYYFVGLNELILNIYFILSSEPLLGKYRDFQVISVYHGKSAIFPEMKLGMTKNIYIQNQLRFTK